MHIQNLKNYQTNILKTLYIQIFWVGKLKKGLTFQYDVIQRSYDVIIAEIDKKMKFSIEHESVVFWSKICGDFLKVMK